MTSKQPDGLVDVSRVVRVFACKVDDLRVESAEMSAGNRLLQERAAFRSKLLVRVDPQYPVSGRQGQRVVARGSEVFYPVEMADLRLTLLSDLNRRVRRAG